MRQNRTIRNALSIAALCGLAGSVAAQRSARADGGAPLMVSASWLAQHLKDPNLVLLHVGEPADYAAKHIPGARFVRLQDISVSDHAAGLMLEMPAPDSLRAMLRRLGISDDSRIVVYYGTDWVSPTTRVVFTLDYAGLGAKTSMLDGGMQSWTGAGHETSAAVPPAREGTLAALHLRPIVVTASYVKAHLSTPGVAIVDARTGEFYDGLESGGMNHDGRPGHIAGARHIAFNSVFDDHNVLLPTSALAALFAKAGVQPADTVVGYCHIGQQATAMLFAARALGHPVLLYDGSFTEWTRLDDAYPVENPNAKRKP